MYYFKHHKSFNINKLRITVPDDLSNSFKDMSIKFENEYYVMNPFYDFDNMHISKSQMQNNFKFVYSFKVPSISIFDESIVYPKPTLEQLYLFYTELTKLLRENNIEI